MNPLPRWFAAVATLGLLTVPVRPALAADEAPILWTGTVQSNAGAAAPAAVTAYLQPPAAGLGGQEDLQLAPIAEATADRAGKFALRASYDDAARSAEDPAGWISVLVVAETPDGISMATDSVRFDTTHRRWSTRPAEEERDGAFKAAMAGSDSGSSDRPAVMRLRPSGAPAEPRFHAATTRYETSPRQRRPAICYMKKDIREVGVTPVTVGELDLARSWGGQFNYASTDTSTLTVGFRYEGEGGWSAGGSSSFGKGGGSESINPVDAEGSPRNLLYRADMVFSTFKMDCGGRVAYQLKPTEWTGGMRTERGWPARCDSRFLTPVGPKASFVRMDGSSQTFAGAFSIFGFEGEASSTNSRSVRHEWKNGERGTRNLCGATALLTKDTRVVSLP